MKNNIQTQGNIKNRKTVKFYVSEEDKLKLVEVAAAEGVSISKWLKDQIDKVINQQLSLDLNIEEEKGDH